MTSEIKTTNHPALCEQPASTVAVLATHDAIYVAYERKRDFLSAPRAFVMLEFDATALVTVNASYMTDEQWAELEQNAFGVYQYNNLDNDYFVVYSEQQVVDIQADTVENISEIYHCEKPEQAIVKLLSTELFSEEPKEDKAREDIEEPVVESIEDSEEIDA